MSNAPVIPISDPATAILNRRSGGLPYGQDWFELMGQCRVFNTGCERAAPAVRRGELPMTNMLLRFPQ